MKRKWLPGVLLALASTLFTLLLLEVVLHIVDFPRKQISHQKIFIEWDSIRGWRNIANKQGRIATDEYVRDLSYNARSMRGPELPYAKPAGTYRILLVGDSFVDAYTEELNDRVGNVLERLLDQGSPARHTEVISLGTGGYSTDQELLWLESEGLRYQPDLVVLLFYYNDIWYNILDSYWRGGKPRFVMEGDSLRLTNVPVPRPGAAPAARGVLGRVNQFVRDNSRLYWVLARVVQNQPKLFGLAVRLGLTEPSPEMVFDASQGAVIAGEFSVFRTDPPPEVARAWSMTDALVRRMRDDAHRSGAAFTAFHVPVRSRIYTQNEDVRANAGSSGTDVDAVTRRFQAMCATDSIPCLEPTSLFVAAADSLRTKDERLYYQYDWHWNHNGHALAARILADSIRLHMGKPW